MESFFGEDFFLKLVHFEEVEETRVFKCVYGEEILVKFESDLTLKKPLKNDS